jgi:hypothetical protein
MLGLTPFYFCFEMHHLRYPWRLLFQGPITDRDISFPAILNTLSLAFSASIGNHQCFFVYAESIFYDYEVITQYKY